jgi:hypothetical protein
VRVSHMRRGRWSRSAKIITTRETIFSELGVTAPRPVACAVGMAVIVNPLAERFVDDLLPLFEAGAMLGERLMPELVKLLDGPAVSYDETFLIPSRGLLDTVWVPVTHRP